jgi:phospholipid N-methyltransferase
MKSFFKVAINSLKTSGTINPSSKYLIKSCLKDIDFETAKTIVEFGTGNGCITKELALLMPSHCQLYSFEINPKFHSYAKNRFSQHSNIEILEMSALDFDQILKAQAITSVDYIISSLPLTLLKTTEAQILLNKVRKHLKQDGLFVQYQYSLSRYGLLKKNFKKVHLSFTMINVPPAFVYTSSNN